MSVIADGIELFLHLLSRDCASKPQCDSSTVNAGIGMCYVVFAFFWLVVWTKFSDKQFSAILTASALVQLLGFVILTVKVRATKSVAGISSKTLELYAVFFVTRLIATCNRNGYVPVDRSGRSVYQLLDVASLVLVIQLLYCIHKTHKYSYQEEHDSLPTFPLIPPCLVLGYFIHADLNRSPLFDTIWATSTNIDTVAMLPQLWMMTKIGGVVEGCTSHFVAAIVASRALALSFWVTAYKDLSGAGSDLAGKQIVVANVLQCLLSADFLYYYLKAKYSGKRMVLPEAPGAPEQTAKSPMEI